jgi:hypothetical protein
MSSKQITNWVNAPKDPSTDYIGFVYLIEELPTGRFYYGIKRFWKRVIRKPLKGKKRRRIDYVESDWRSYKTSNDKLQVFLKQYPEQYTCTILEQCESVTEMKAKEAFFQLNTYLHGDKDNMINEMINLRVRLRK